MKYLLYLLLLTILWFPRVEAKATVRYYTDGTISAYTETDDDTGRVSSYFKFDSNNKIQAFDGELDGHTAHLKYDTELIKSTYDTTTFTWKKNSEKFVPTSYTDTANKTSLTFTYDDSKNTKFHYSGTFQGRTVAGEGELSDTEYFGNKEIDDMLHKHIKLSNSAEKIAGQLDKQYSK